MKDRCLEFYIKYGERETRYELSYGDLWLDGYITWDALDLCMVVYLRHVE